MTEPTLINHSISELLKMFNIEQINDDEIIENTNAYIEDAIQSEAYDVADYFENAKNHLLDYAKGVNASDNEGEEEEEEEEEKEITEVYESEFKENDINPLTNKTEKKFLVLDSQVLPEYTPKTDYVATLSTQIKNVMNIRLHSFSIPYTWYAINNSKKNNFITLLTEDNVTKIQIAVEDGNYSTTQMISALNDAIFDANVKNSNGETEAITYNEINGKIKIDLYNYRYQNYSVKEVIFFEPNQQYLLGEEDIFSTMRAFKNITLGWMLGYRTEKETIIQTGNIGTAVVDLKGPKYLYIVVDDYKRNHTTNNLVTITKILDDIKVPNYYSDDQPLNCNSETLAVLPSAPRTLTQAQIYTINEIMRNKNQTDYYTDAPNDTDILAVIPLKLGSANIGDRIVEMSGQLQDSRRDYNGPVDIERLGIKLIDDTGFIVDLNNSDWTISLLYEYIYHY